MDAGNFMKKEQCSDSCRKDKLESGAFSTGAVPEQKGLEQTPFDKGASLKALRVFFHSWGQFGFFFWGVLQLQNKTHLNVIRAQCGNLSTRQGWKQPGLSIPRAVLAVLWQHSHPRLRRCWAGFLWAFLTSLTALLTWREQGHRINTARKTIFSSISLNVHYWWFCWIIYVDEWLQPSQLSFRDDMSAEYMCSEHYCGAAPQPGNVWLDNLGDWREISGLFGTSTSFPWKKKLEGKKGFLLPSPLIDQLILINVAEGLGTMPSRDRLGIRFQVVCCLHVCNLRKCGLLFRNIVLSTYRSLWS